MWSFTVRLFNEDLKEYSPTKTKVGQKWYESIALSLLFNRWYFLFLFKETLLFKVYITASAFNDHKN